MQNIIKQFIEIYLTNYGIQFYNGFSISMDKIGFPQYIKGQISEDEVVVLILVALFRN